MSDATGCAVYTHSDEGAAVVWKTVEVVVSLGNLQEAAVPHRGQMANVSQNSKKLQQTMNGPEFIVDVSC